MPTPPRSGLSSRNSFDHSHKTSRRDNGLISPAKSTFSFADEIDPMSLPASEKPSLIDETQISGPYGRGSPGDAALIAMVNKDRASTDLSRRKSQFYSEVFAYREPNLTVRDRVHRYSIITAEVKTNVIVSRPSPEKSQSIGDTNRYSHQVKDEYVFLQDLSQHLSQRYQRPVSSIFITLNHSECLLYAGSFDSAYIMTITALPTQIQPTTNKRNAVMIQKFMADSLGVTPERGVVRFVGIAEEYLATNGNTVLGEIENMSKESSEDSANGTQRTGTLRRPRSRRSSKPEKLQMPLNSRPGTSDNKLTSPPRMSPPIPTMPEKVPRMGRRRSFLALFAGNRNKVYA
ncbi:MAG: hypothetical protein Q9182_004208 [Xanthomendoza sp. 2 TL-2023]